jgi:hypothetical protein
MAWRPWYQPQLPHTMCGTLAAPQRGQTLRDGAFNVHADARRLRLFIFEVFFFGTAIAKRRGYRPSDDSVELQVAEAGPARVDVPGRLGANRMTLWLGARTSDLAQRRER